MVTKTYIASNLKQIESLYDSTTSVQKSLFYSKLAVIELCGWIEMTMDDIVLRLAKRRLQEPSNHKYIEKEIVRRTYGFDYERHFLPMIEAIIGRHGIEQMNKEVDHKIIQPLIGALSILKAERDKLAHQYIKGTTLNIDAPSATKARFPIILAGLKNIEGVLLKKQK
jgi:hypothetical protein